MKLRPRLCFYLCLWFCTWWGAIPACIAGGIPACLAAGLRGCLLPGDVCSWGGSAPGGSAPRGCGLLLWPSGLVPSDWRWPSGWKWSSVMAFWCDLLLWPSGKAFWYWEVSPNRPNRGVSPNRDPFQPEGHNRRPYQNGLLVWPSGVIFYGLPPPSPKKTAIVADGTHPTGMHSCCPVLLTVVWHMKEKVTWMITYYFDW